MKKVIIPFILQLMTLFFLGVNVIQTQEHKELWQRGLDNLARRDFKTEIDKQLFEDRLSKWTVERLKKAGEYAKDQKKSMKENESAWEYIAKKIIDEQQERLGYIDSMGNALQSFFRNITATVLAWFGGSQKKTELELAVKLKDKTYAIALNELGKNIYLYAIDDDTITKIGSQELASPPQAGTAIPSKGLVFITEWDKERRDQRGSLKVYRFTKENTLQLLQQFDTGRFPNSVTVVGDESYIVVSSRYDCNVHLYKVTDNVDSPLVFEELRGVDYFPSAVLNIPNTNTIIVSSTLAKTLALYMVSDSKLSSITENVQTEGFPVALTMMPENRLVLALSREYAGDVGRIGQIELYKLSDNKLSKLRSVVSGRDPIAILSLPEHNLVLVANKGDSSIGMYKIEKESISFLREVKVEEDSAPPVAITRVPNTNYILVINQLGNKITMYELQNDNLILKAHVRSGEYPVEIITFSLSTRE